MTISQRVVPPSGFIRGREGWLWSVWRARKHRGFVRALRIVALVVVALELGYVLVANVVLKTGLIERFVNDEPQDLQVSFEKAWTIFPGRLHVQNFALRLQDENVQVWLRIPQARLRVKLGELLVRRFHVSDLKAEGLSFRIRGKISALESETRRARAFPPIEGFSDPPLALYEPAEAGTGAEKWTIEIEGVDAAIKELWLFEYRYLGEGRGTGGFRLKPTDRLRVDSSTVELAPGTLTLGEKTVVAGHVGGRVECRVDDFELRNYRGLHVFQRISGKGLLTAQLADTRFSDVYFGPPAGVAIKDGAGPLALDVQLDHGTLMPGSRLTYDTGAIELQTPPYRFIGDAALEASVIGKGAASSARVVLSGKRVSVHGKRAYARTEAAIVSEPRVQLDSTASRVDGDWSMQHASFDSASVTLDDIRLLNALLGADGPVKFGGGALGGHARAEITSEGWLLGKVDIAARATELTILDKVVVRTTGTLESELRQDLARDGGRLVGLKAVFEPVSIKNAAGSSGNGRLQIDDGIVLYEDLAPHGIKATLRARFPETEPVLAAFGVKLGGVPKLATALTDLSDLRATAKLRHDSTVTEVHVLDARTRGAKSAGRWRREGKHARGAFLVDTPLLQVGVTVDDDGASVSPFVPDSWLEKKLSELELSSRSN
jgi:hypothetical protein